MKSKLINVSERIKCEKHAATSNYIIYTRTYLGCNVFLKQANFLMHSGGERLNILVSHNNMLYLTFYYCN